MPQEHSNRGFAAMDPKKQREIASKGGQSVPAAKRSFSQNPTLAAAAGRKGGEARGHHSHGTHARDAHGRAENESQAQDSKSLV